MIETVMRGIGCGALALALGGCAGGGSFQCADNDQCRTGDAFGVCQPDGFCSFDDPACASGQRYGDQSGDLAGECVDVGSSSASSGAEPTSSGPISTTTGGADTTGGPDASTDDGGSTLALDGTSTGADATTSGVETGSDGSTGTMASCSPIFSDEFDDDVVDPLYDGTVGPGMSVFESGGELHFAFDGATADGYAWIGRHVGSLDSHRYWVHVSGLPSLPSSSSLEICLSDEIYQVCVLEYEGQLHAHYDDGVSQTELATMIIDPVAIPFIAVSILAGEVGWETSADGVAFSAFHTMATPFDPAANLYMLLGAGNWEVLAADDEYAIEALGFCEE
jgi:hypothetical protein